MSLTICAFKIELPTRRCAAVNMYVGKWGSNFIVAQWLISTLGAQIDYLHTHTHWHWVGKNVGNLFSKIKILRTPTITTSNPVRDILSPLNDLFGTSNRMLDHVEN